MLVQLTDTFNPIDNEIVNESIKTLLQNSKGREGIEVLNNKIDSIIDGSSNSDEEDEFKHQMKMLIKNNILGEIGLFTKDLPSEIEPLATSSLETLISSILESNEDIFTAIDTANPQVDSKKLVEDCIKSKSQGTSDEAVQSMVGDAIKLLAGKLYGNDSEFQSVNSIVDMFLGTLIGGKEPTVGEILDILDPYIQGGIELNGRTYNFSDVKTLITNNINSSFQQTATNGTFDPIAGIVSSGIDTLIDKLNSNIQDVFCQNSEILSAVETVIPIRKLIADAEKSLKDSIMDGLTGNNNSSNTNNSKEKTEKVKKDVEETNKEKAEDAKNKEEQSNEQPAASESSSESKDSESNKSSKKSNNVENRKESKNEEKKEKEDPEEPPLENYDNSKPSPAPVESDPRKGSQELVLWEGGGGHYVLLRDKPGNYVCLDEGGNNVRIQNVSGSFIELRGNGDIVIQAANKVYINCAGSSYVKKS